MDDDGLGDWRIQAATRLAKDIPAAYSGGPSHKAGAPVYQNTLMRDSSNCMVGFITPSSTALGLSIAVNAAKKAKEIFRNIEFSDGITPQGKGKNVNVNSVTALYDYFELCMIAVTFSFQALETFSNHTIASKLNGAFELQRRKEIKTFTPLELERVASMEEKLSIILPSVLQFESPKGKKVWQNFVKLKNARNATIHLKSTDQYQSQFGSIPVDFDPLFYQFLNDETASLTFLQYAINMIKYFIVDKPRWLLGLQMRISSSSA